MKTAVFYNQKGGVGKTVAAINTARGLSTQGNRVLFIDADDTESATKKFIDRNLIKNDLSDLLFDLSEETILNSLHQVSENLVLIPSRKKLANSEIQLRSRQDIPQQFVFRRLLDILKKNFDYCIIDCPGATNLLVINAIVASDLVIVPVITDEDALEGYENVVEQISNIKRNFALNTKIKALFTMIKRNNNDKKVLEQFGENLRFNTTIRFQAKPISDASLETDFSKKFVIDNVKSNVGLDYQQFIEELEGSL